MHPNHIITNILVRVQETRLNTNYDPLESEESEIAKLAAVLDGLPNTFISYKWIEKHPALYQAHLEQIADFLQEGPSKWWVRQEGGIEFLDKTGSDSAQRIHMEHVRSSNLASVRRREQQAGER